MDRPDLPVGSMHYDRCGLIRQGARAARTGRGATAGWVDRAGARQRSDGWMAERSPIRIAVTSAWARLAAPSFW